MTSHQPLIFFAVGRAKLLKSRLKIETNNMITQFTVLVGKTLVSILEKKTSVKTLRTTLTNLNGRNGNKLTEQLQKISDMDEAFFELTQFWSFFEYNILTCIIQTFSSELQPELDRYTSLLKEYCKRRIHEVPDDSGCSEESEEEKILYIRIDKSFSDEIKRIKIEDLTDLESNIGLLLGTNLLYLEIMEGSIIISFKCLHEFDVIFPLCPKQEEELKKIGVTGIYSKNHEYFRHSLPLTETGWYITNSFNPSKQFNPLNIAVKQEKQRKKLVSV